MMSFLTCLPDDRILRSTGAVARAATYFWVCAAGCGVSAPNLELMEASLNDYFKPKKLGFPLYLWHTKQLEKIPKKIMEGEKYFNIKN